MTMMADTQATTDRELVITRTINAPRELVFAAWTDAQHVDAWWGPRGFTTETIAIDVRIGGSWHYVMRGPDGVEYPNLTTYQEIVRPERLVYLHGEPGDPDQFQTTVTFEEQGGATLLTMRSLFRTAEMCEGARSFGAVELGYTTLDCLDEFLSQREGRNELVVSRLLKAPRELVFRAWTDPEMMPKWWGPRSQELTLCELDVRPGGTWRVISRGPDGVEQGFRGVYQEVVPPVRLVSTFSWDGAPDQVSTDDLTLEERDGRTLLIARSIYPAGADMQAILATGMMEGWLETLDRLRELVEG